MVELSTEHNEPSINPVGKEGISTQSVSVHDLSYKLKGTNGASERLKFVGKHSKDKVLAIYLLKRMICEVEMDFKVENLHGVVRVSQFQAERIIEKDQGTKYVILKFL